MRILLILSLLITSAVLGGCGGGGGGGEGNAAVNGGAITGSLIVAPNQTLESEPNDSAAAAQSITEVQKVAGQAAAADPGFQPPGLAGTVIQDLYRVEASDRLRLVLTLATNAPGTNDLDLVLLDSSGALVDAAEGRVATEVLETPVAGTFLIGVRATSGASNYLLSLEPLGQLAGLLDDVPEEADFVPGEILVRPRAGNGGSYDAPAQIAKRYGLSVKELFEEGYCRMDFVKAPDDGKGDDKLKPDPDTPPTLRQETLERLRQLRLDPEVEYAEPNYLRHALLTPDDDLFPLQWHYNQINLPLAWDTTTGGAEVIMAVVDTGILPGHPDLAGRLTTGFDFISDLTVANDGDGIDPDPTDPGDDPAGASSSFHGTHVAGLVGANTDNLTGISGTTWQGSIMPVRALGVGGGIDSDIAQAIRYAAGLANASGTLPAAPADVINLSFGGPAFSQTVNDAVQAARAAGSVIVAAAGNNNTNTSFFPASYSGVVSVTAVDLNSQKAAYANFGSQIDVAAPGGDISRDLNGDGQPDGVLSTLGDGAGNFFYRFQAGTSMAAPHVAGVAGLMKAVNPTLTPQDFDLLLAGTHAETAVRITRDLGATGRDDLFGHGLIDASQAIRAAQSLAGGTGVILNDSRLSVSASALDFGNSFSALSLEVTNGGGGTLSITDISTDVPWLSVAPTSGAAPLTLLLTADRSGLASGTYRANVTIVSDAGGGPLSTAIEVTMTVGTVSLGNIGTAFVLVIAPGTGAVVAQDQTDFGRRYAFRIAGVESGSYLLAAGTDRDGDGLVCDIEDACGFFPGTVTVDTGEEVSGIAFPVGELVTPQSIDLPATPLRRVE